MDAPSKKVSCLMILLMILASLNLGSRSAATPEPTLRVDPPSIVDTALTPGSTFHVNITVVNVENLWAYQFKLTYNTTVLEVVGNQSYAPFTQFWSVKINETEGSVFLLYGLRLGTQQGFYGTTALGGVDFRVDALGLSTLHLLPYPDTILADNKGAPIPATLVDGFFTNIKVHDLAVTGVTASPVRVSNPGDLTSIDVLVTNKSPDFSETFNVTVSYNQTIFGNATDVFIAAGDNATVSFTWDTTGVAIGEYTITAQVIVASDNIPSNNINSLLKVRIGVIRDVAVVSVAVAPTEAIVGEPASVTVNIKNLGDYDENVTVNAKYDGTAIGTKSALLSKGATQSMSFDFETSDIPVGKYTISAEIIVDIDDNTTNNIVQGIAFTVTGYYVIPPILIYAVVGLVVIGVVVVILRRVLRARKPTGVVRK